MKKNLAFDPVDVTFSRARRIVFALDRIADLVEELIGSFFHFAVDCPSGLSYTARKRNGIRRIVV